VRRDQVLDRPQGVEVERAHRREIVEGKLAHLASWECVTCVYRKFDSA
jgi:hypothetical protein